MQKTVTVDEFRTSSLPLIGQEECWRVGLAIGSMIYFDFGSKKPVRTIRNTTVLVGSTVLSVRNAYWDIIRAKSTIYNSDRISRADVEGLENLFLGQKLIDVSLELGWLQISFSSEMSIQLDRGNKYQLEGEIAEIGTPDSRIWDFQADGSVLLSDPIWARDYGDTA